MSEKKDSQLRAIFFRYVLPVAFIIFVILTLILHKGTIDSEIPIDYIQDPLPPQQCEGVTPTK